MTKRLMARRTSMIAVWFGLTVTFLSVIVVGIWLIKPYNIISVQQPLEVVNAGDIINVGEPIQVVYEYTKYESIEADVYPFITCSSGNLTALKPFKSNLPEGHHVVTNSDYTLPPKFLSGDKCQLTITQTYEVNPIRKVSYTFNSEYFVIGDANAK